MTPERALQRIQQLMALAAPGSGAAEEEQRTAALTAVNIMREHRLVPGQHAESNDSVDEMLGLALRLAELERQFVMERTAHAEELREQERRWRNAVDEARWEERWATKAAVKRAKKVTLNREREAQASAGGRARAEQLGPERRSEIAREAAKARWARSGSGDPTRAKER